MNKVLCFGEALIDFLHTGDLQDDGVSLNQFTQFPGGAPANAAVAVAKLGGDAAFLGQVGADMFGEFLKRTLSYYKVDTQYVLQHPTLKTALAFVARDNSGERRFSFYRSKSADLAFDACDAPPESFREAKVFHFCSNTLTDRNITSTTKELIERAREAGALISFDVNLRHNLWPMDRADPIRVNQFVKMADVLKFSREEILYLTSDIEGYLAELLEEKARLIVITDDGDTIHYYSPWGHGLKEPPKVNVIDTTAGGDSFSGGLLFQISQLDDFESTIRDEQKVDALIGFAASCGAFTVTKQGAFPALPTLDVVRADLPAFLKL